MTKRKNNQQKADGGNHQGQQNNTNQAIVSHAPNGKQAAGVLRSDQVQTHLQVGEERNADVVLHLFVALDQSPSMAFLDGQGQTRMDVALNCVKGLCKSDFVLPSDKIIMYTFDEEQHFVLKCKMGKLDYKKLAGNVQTKMATSGGTAVRDAFSAMMKEMKSCGNSKTDDKNRKILRYLLVFTDGEDNRSRVTWEELANQLQTLSLPDCHVNLVAVGIGEQSKGYWNNVLGRFPRLAKLVVGNDWDIRQAFDAAIEHLRSITVSFRGTKAQAAVFGQAVTAGVKSVTQSLSNTCIAAGPSQARKAIQASK